MRQCLPSELIHVSCSVETDSTHHTAVLLTCATAKKIDATTLSADQQPVFAITPDKCTLGPKEATTFTLSLFSSRPGSMTETLVCTATTTGASKTSSSSNTKRVFEVAAKADVAAPLLDFSSRSMRFEYSHTHGSCPEPMTQLLTIRNVSKLPLAFSLKTAVPFAVEPCALELQPGGSQAVAVTLDPDFRHDMQSQLVKQKLLVTYSDNPQKDSVELVGDIQFPNLTFDSSALDFGCVLSDSTRRMVVTLTNPTKVAARYSWAWLKPDATAGSSSAIDGGLSSATVGSAASNSSSSRFGPAPPPSQLFDILPIAGTVAPGQCERVEFAFFGFPGVKAAATAVCHVEDGPDYKMQLSGESSSIKYAVEPLFFDCGMQTYDRPVERDLWVSGVQAVYMLVKAAADSSVVLQLQGTAMAASGSFKGLLWQPTAGFRNAGWYQQ